MNLNNISKWKYSNFLINKSYNFNRKTILKLIPSNLLLNSNKTISSWKNYKKTPLLKLGKLNRNLKLNNIFYKDESKRFHLKSFKALGGAYAVEKIAKGKKNLVISSATAGNHGRSVAWGAQRLGLQCKIFVSQYVSETRIKEIKKLGAEVIRVRGNYEASLRECQLLSKKNNWSIVQDVSTKNYSYVPLLTMAGYSIMIKEISKQTTHYITHIFLQAGVGGMAAAMVAGIAKYLNHVPIIIVVEPDSAACVMESIKTGKIKKIDIKRESLMGGMSCGEVSLVPWEILKNSVKHCISLPDDDIAKTMKLLGNSSFSNDKIVAGENSAPGVISLIASCEDQAIKEKLDLNEKSNVLVFGCEGDTDQEMYQKLINQN